MNRLPHVRNAIYSQPWAITEVWLEAICEMFEVHAAGNTPNFNAKASESKDKASALQIVDGVAVIPVRGPIFPRANLMTQLSGATSLDDLSALLTQAENEDISAIILDIDSPGGSVMGAPEFCSQLMDIRESSMNLLSLINGTGCSLAYMIASQCDAVYATEGSMAGSIGVVAKIDNNDRAQRNQGNDSIVLRSSELKAIGTGPVTPAQQQDMQRILQGHFAAFKATVQRGRPAIDMDSVATGQVWRAVSHNSDPSAVDMGLVDGVSTLSKLIDQYGGKINT